MGKITDFVKGVALPQQKARQALALDAEFENALLNSQKSDARILQLEAEVNPLKREVEALKQEIAQLKASAKKDDLVFNKTTGTHTDPATGDHYCTRCLPKRSPLKDEPHGWRCVICRATYDDPARPWPQITLGGPLA